MNYSWNKEAFKHAIECEPHECCGLLYKENGTVKYGACKNLAYDNPELSFVIEPLDWKKYEDLGEINGIVHSHPKGEFKFSETDISSCNYLDIDFFLVDPASQSIISIKPKNEKN